MTGVPSDAVVCDYHRNELEASEGPKEEKRIEGIRYIRTGHATTGRIGFKGEGRRNKIEEKRKKERKGHRETKKYTETDTLVDQE